MIPRLYLEAELESGTALELPDEQARYLRQVLRRRAGDAIVLFNGRGGEFQAIIELLDKRNARASIQAFSDISREPEKHMHIVQAACRNEKIEFMLQKGVELGAASFQIVHTQRSTLRLKGARLSQRLNRWRKIIIEAVEQSGRTRIPTLHWRHYLDEIEAPGLRLCLHPAGARSWAEMRNRIMGAETITLAIGPEGGWSPPDLDILSGLGFENLRFGPRILRTETAAPALLAAIQAVSLN